MFGNTIRHLPYIRTYAEAEKQFNKRGAVRSKKWAENERPIYKTYHHYRVTKHAEYYDLILYRTVMARYFTPQTIDGKLHERCLYMGNQSITSRDFMWHVLGVHRGNKEILEGDKLVVAPIYHRASLHHDGEPFSADYLYVDGVLDTTKSVHTKHYRKVSNADDKRRRTEVANVFEPYILMAQMRMPEFHAEAEISNRLGVPFANSMSYKYEEAIRAIACGSTEQSDIDTFFEMCKSAYEMLASKRGYEQGDFNMGSSWRNITADSIDKLKKQITPPEFRTTLVGRIMKMTGADERTELVEIPQFVVESDYPRTNIVLKG